MSGIKRPWKVIVHAPWRINERIVYSTRSRRSTAELDAVMARGYYGDEHVHIEHADNPGVRVDEVAS